MSGELRDALAIAQLGSIIIGGLGVGVTIIRFIWRMDVRVNEQNIKFNAAQSLLSEQLTAAIREQNAATDRHNQEISSLKTEIKGLNSILTTVAVQSTEIQGLRRDVDDLRRGKGFITDDWPRKPEAGGGG